MPLPAKHAWSGRGGGVHLPLKSMNTGVSGRNRPRPKAAMASITARSTFGRCFMGASLGGHIITQNCKKVNKKCI